MQFREVDALLRERLREEQQLAKSSRFSFLKRRKAAVRADAAAARTEPEDLDDTPAPARRSWRLRLPRLPSRSDFLVASMGIGLGLTCALFPWYIFFNPDKFGVRAMKFSGQNGPVSGPISIGNQPQRIGAPMSVDDIPTLQLDLFATGTVNGDGEADGQAATSLEDQPFPFEEPEFRLVHVANGRAMIEDDAGLFVVQRGSRLPDNSRVAAIEQRAGKWVLVTSADRVVVLAE